MGGTAQRVRSVGGNSRGFGSLLGFGPAGAGGLINVILNARSRLQNLTNQFPQVNLPPQFNPPPFEGPVPSLFEDPQFQQRERDFDRRFREANLDFERRSREANLDLERRLQFGVSPMTSITGSTSLF